MDIKDKTIIVTGGAQGIGAALAKRFLAQGATTAKLNIGTNDTPAGNCIGVECDVTNEAQVVALVDTAKAQFGQVDVFCSNAGVYLDEPGHGASASNDTWNRCWNLHVMAHVYAARAVLPDMIDRGDGYLLQMSSAAGLLSQIGNAAYSATKHAAIGFAESLAITHGGDGIKVSVICPQYVATPMLGYSDNTPLRKTPGVISPEELAETVVQGIEQECFLILPHPQVAKFIQFKSANYDKWLSEMRNLKCKIETEIGSLDLTRMHTFI